MSAFKGKASNKGGEYDQCPAGNHSGYMLGLIDLGTHYESYKGQDERKVRKVFFVFEVEAADKRHFIGKDYNLGLNEAGEVIFGQKANIRKLLEGWRGKPYGDKEDIDLTAIHGRPCLVNVISKPSGDKSFAEISGVSSLPKGMTPLVPSKPKILYSADSDDAAPGSGDDPEWLPRIFGAKIEDVLAQSIEWGGDGRRTSADGKAAEKEIQGGNGQATTAAPTAPTEAAKPDTVPF